ncbi:unnamed protein product [Medioppia subpectinata]|uniref:Glycoside hydrolase family 38 central domain-containing protein n=1 Tax=Medioppia subpectinata TaxID=1979941 RepID=A0A7R9KAU0_9ACAR|nr:unnamed protein product [Medioppia subpectinata]CAG2100057.1 unnamed protein product [Medioppia subpectinata]
MSETGFTGFDLRHNLDAVDGAHGIYSTDYYTESAVKLISDHNIERPLFVYMSYQSVHSANSPYELQAPKQLVDKFSYIKDENRRIFAATLYSMDLSIGRIVNELHNKNILNNTIILFMSDNGAAISGFMAIIPFITAVYLGAVPAAGDVERLSQTDPPAAARFVNYIRQYSGNYSTNQLLIPMVGKRLVHEHGQTDPYRDTVLALPSTGASTSVLVRYWYWCCDTNGTNGTREVLTGLEVLTILEVLTGLESNNTLTSKSDDFFPYASDNNTYWTGYFTSRPALKRYERVGNNFLQVCKQLDVLAGMGGAYDKEVTALREWQAVMQHHDAITGTEKQHVADNYALKLAKSIACCERVVDRAVAKLAAKSMANRTVQSVPEQLFCQQLNVSACEWTESLNTSLAVTVYNPYGQPVRHILRLPITDRSHVLELKERVSEAVEELVFKASVPALGFATYILKPQDTGVSRTAPLVRRVERDFRVQTPGFNVHFDGYGRLQALQFRDSGRTVSVRQEFAYLIIIESIIKININDVQ